MLLAQWLEYAVMEDWNANFGTETGVKGQGNSSKNAKAFVAMMDRRLMSYVEMVSMSKGPVYTV